MANNYLAFSFAVSVKADKAELLKGYLDYLEPFMLEAAYEDAAEKDEDVTEQVVKNAITNSIVESEAITKSEIFGQVCDLLTTDHTVEFIKYSYEINEGPGFLGCMMEFREADKTMYIYTDDDDSPYMGSIARFIELLFKLDFLDETSVLIDFCWYCSKPRVGQFGGNAVLISPDLGVVFREGSDEWAMHTLKGY